MKKFVVGACALTVGWGNRRGAWTIHNATISKSFLTAPPSEQNGHKMVVCICVCEKWKMSLHVICAKKMDFRVSTAKLCVLIYY